MSLKVITCYALECDYCDRRIPDRESEFVGWGHGGRHQRGTTGSVRAVGRHHGWPPLLHRLPHRHRRRSVCDAGWDGGHAVERNPHHGKDVIEMAGVIEVTDFEVTAERKEAGETRSSVFARIDIVVTVLFTLSMLISALMVLSVMVAITLEAVGIVSLPSQLNVIPIKAMALWMGAAGLVWIVKMGVATVSGDTASCSGDLGCGSRGVRGAEPHLRLWVPERELASILPMEAGLDAVGGSPTLIPSGRCLMNTVSSKSAWMAPWRPNCPNIVRLVPIPSKWAGCRRVRRGGNSSHSIQTR